MTQNQDPNVVPPVGMPPEASIPPSPGVGYATPAAASYASAYIEENKDARLWGMLCHLGAFGGYIIPLFGKIIGPLVFWLIKKDEHPFVDEQGKEALNFQITVIIAAIVCIPLCFLIIGFPLLFAVGIADIVFVIIAAIKTNKGEHYRYPFALRLIK